MLLLQTVHKVSTEVAMGGKY